MQIEMFGPATAVLAMAILMATLEQFCWGNSDLTDISSSSTPMTTSSGVKNLDPNCRERNSLTKQTRSTLLSEGDLSRAAELCMAGNDQLVLYLRSLLGGLAEKSSTANQTTKPVRRFGFRRRNHAANMTSRAPTLNYLTLSAGQRSVCIGPDIKLQSLKVYELARSPGAMSVYLVTGKNDELGTSTSERIVLTSPDGHLVTVFLGTSQMWKFSGDAVYSSRVYNETHMSLTLGDVKVVLSRHVTLLNVLYSVDMTFNESTGFGGLLGDILSSRTDEESDQDGELQDRSCGSLALHSGLVDRHSHSPMKFTHFFLDLMLDIAKNLPIGVFESTSKQGK